ncbi:unnamed protein product [Rotaria socialis]|uniref:Uncharacterized protein n=1 Tax=Rotaria socialis TaxID=392032 RepID=A0A820U7J3_9BILA|nr:unnamed protein product [Rotaria socialis]CAF3325225.1 unnamed protein product [Rotaria socialis]CAF3538572.1 unnamed protein product [Rotaria socialis]CAF3695174.1 unnamed protein product [Rotaria socialis]CAF3719502.1 unnamed protein product [Rotaria socialis]
MIILNNSLLSSTITTATTTTTSTTPNNLYLNSTVEIYNSSSLSIIITIVILSFLSISGWIFMSYTLFGRSEAYRAKPDDQFGSSNLTNNSDRANGNDFFFDID